MPTHLIPLRNAVPLALASELQKRLYFASSEIVDFNLIERDQQIQSVEIVANGDNGRHELAAKINALVESDILKQKAFPPKVVWRSKSSPAAGNGGATRFHEELFDTLIDRGIAFESGEGQVGFGEPLITLMDYLDERLKRIALDMHNSQEYRYPTLLPTHVLDEFGYFGSFPHFMMFVTRLHNDIDVYRAFQADYAAHGEIPPSLYTHCHNHDYCLPPTMCYHTYHQLRDQQLVGNQVVTAKGKSFRFESKYYRGLERLWDFTIREIVFLGTREFVLDCRQSFMRATYGLMEELELFGFCEVANDPFFVAQDTAGKIFSQRMMELKYELRVHTSPTETIAAGSFNFHETFFGETFKIMQDGSTPILTGCVGFGLERFIYAFLCQHGLDEQAWPARVREDLSLA